MVGKLLTPNGIKPLTKKANVLSHIEEPKSFKEVKSFFHMCLWHSQFVPKFGEVMWPLSALLCEHSINPKTDFNNLWTDSCVSAFCKVKQLIADVVELH